MLKIQVPFIFVRFVMVRIITCGIGTEPFDFMKFKQTVNARLRLRWADAPLAMALNVAPELVEHNRGSRNITIHADHIKLLELKLASNRKCS